MKKYILLVLALVLCGIPLVSSASGPYNDPGYVKEIADPNPNTSTCISLSYNLRYQSRDSFTNGEVSMLQDFLQAQNYVTFEPTGYFGLMTNRAVKVFQQSNNIGGDGFVGPITRAKIKSISCGSSNNTQYNTNTNNTQSYYLKAPTISKIESAASYPGTVYAGESAAITGTGLSGYITIKIGNQESKTVRVKSISDTYAKFTFPSRSQSAVVSVSVTNDSGLISNYYQVNVNVSNNSVDQNYNPDVSITISSPYSPAKVGNYYTGYLGVKDLDNRFNGVSTNLFNWSLSSGSLPDGLILSSSGFGEVIIGTPTTPGTYKFTLNVTSLDLSQTYGDPKPPYVSGTRKFTIEVLDNNDLVINTSSNLAIARVGQEYPGINLQASGGTGEYVWSLTSGTPWFPVPGLSLYASSGAYISGVPAKVYENGIELTTPKTFSFDMTVTSGSQSVNKTFYIIVYPENY